VKCVLLVYIFNFGHVQEYSTVGKQPSAAKGRSHEARGATSDDRCVVWAWLSACCTAFGNQVHSHTPYTLFMNVRIFFESEKQRVANQPVF
jgi:hypothetical protein